jgi:hypothetical protein
MAVRNDFTAGEVLAAADLNDTFASKLDLAGGKILQVVRATDSTNRSTSSTSYVDASLSVTITPQKSDSAIFVIWSHQSAPSNGALQFAQLTDNSNNALSGAEGIVTGSSANSFNTVSVIVGYSTPATTSATTYKARFRTGNAIQVCNLLNATITGQLFAIEVSA